jgi:DNA-binding MarR family transcriptional regulator
MIETTEKMITEEIKRLAPVLGKENASRLTRAYLLADEETKKRIFELVDVIKAGVFSDKDLRDAALRQPPEPREPGRGDIEIGWSLYGRKRMHPFYLNKNTFLSHMGIFGSSGYGKTNLAYSLIEKLSDEGIPVIIFDFSKRNYKDLLSTPLEDRIDIYTIGRNVSPFKFNPLKPPPGIQLSQWMKEFASIFDHAYWLLGGGRHIILKALDNVYMTNQHPTLQDLKAWLDEYGSSSLAARERNWIATAERPLESLCFKEVGEVFQVKEGLLPSEFFKPGRITILELDALDTNDKTFFIEILLQWIRDWLLVNWKKEKLAGVMFLEEAHHILNRDKAKKPGAETVMELVFREVRELGLGIIYIDQHPSLVSYPALGNTSTHIYMNLGLDTKQSSDIQDASNMLGLDEEETPYLRQLPVGHGFILCRMSLQSPFLIEFPKYPLEKGAITDRDIIKKMGRKTTKAPEKERGGAEIPETDEQGMKIIRALGLGEGSFTSQIYRKTKMSGKTFERSVKRLIKQGLVGMKKAKTGRNVLHFYFLTEAGNKIFGRNFEAKEKAARKDASNIVSALEEAGWVFDRKGNRLVFEGGNKRLVVMIEDSQDRKKMAGDLEKTMYFICLSDRIRNVLLQEAARLSYQSGPLTIHIASPEKFSRKAEFDRIDFK